MNKNKTLVIHPKDETTDCLAVIYKDRGWDVINDPSTSPEEICKAIRTHDRIIMLGHGTPYGLLAAVDNNRFGRYIITSQMVPYLERKETFSIWCNSSSFFKKHRLKGLHTGMIISEVGEEYMIFSECPLSESEMEKNMEMFCGAFAKYIDLDPEEMKNKVLEEYVGSDKVTEFNRKNITVL